MTKICSVIPAAGKGSRLGVDCPKILVPIREDLQVWDILRDALSPVSEQIHVVVSPAAAKQFTDTVNAKVETESKRRTQSAVTVSEQAVPRGMGDAIFGAEPFWKNAEAIIIVWGDQVNLSADTIAQVAAQCRPERTMVLPLVECRNPYVQYDLTDGKLTKVRQSREGDVMDEVGLSDVGIFALSVDNLASAWRQFESESEVGAQTNEVNFLPFLPFLSSALNWELRTVNVLDPIEAVGINTKEELEITRKRFSK